MRAIVRHTITTSLALMLAAPLAAQTPGAQAAPSDQTPAAKSEGDDIPGKYVAPTAGYDYETREVMIPMRDGVKLHTMIVVPRQRTGLPILLTRTPYDASGRVKRSASPTMLGTLPQGDEVFVEDGYIRVFQDIRGKYGSEGEYVMTRHPRGPFNPTTTDDATDAYDTIDWLIRNVKESNGRVGMLGSSYEGWTAVMALLDPHPALKVAAPESPMVDGWLGDDWFHYGAYRQNNLDYFTGQMGARGKGPAVVRSDYDDYTAFLRMGSAGAWAEAAGFDQLPYWKRFSSHPAYDRFWQAQALDKLLAAKPSTVPTMWIQGLFDQEDMWGAVHAWTALKQAGHESTNYLVMGPWRHSGVNYDGSSLGPLNFKGDTATEFRRDVLLPFFNRYLKDRQPAEPTPRALIYNTGENHWDRLADWPGACIDGCGKPLTPIYLQTGFGLGFGKPAAAKDAADSYASDPAKPVPYLPPPISFADGERWRTWLVTDQRFAATRPDVLVYQTPPLTTAVKVQGAPVADLFAATTGTDGDWVVKLIDVYPDAVPSNPKMGGYQLPISLDIFRGRYRTSFSDPKPIAAGKTLEYKFVLPTVNHVFLPGHRIMVQIQSALFPLYDRNPQTYVDNIFFAKPGDFRKATATVARGGATASAVLLPVVK